MNSHLFQPSTVTVTFFAVSATATEHIICIISHVHGCEVEERELITLIFALRHENTEVFASFDWNVWHELLDVQLYYILMTYSAKQLTDLLAVQLKLTLLDNDTILQFLEAR